MLVDVLVGLQWGSEAKGRVISSIAHRYDLSVRVGGPNAGHTVFYGPHKVINRSVPCAWVNPSCLLVIGAGAAIHMPTLEAELALLMAVDGTVVSRLVIDRNAVIIDDSDEEWERMHLTHMASTTHGIGSAYMRKMQRSSSKLLVRDVYGSAIATASGIIPVEDTVGFMHDHGGRVLLEGTQGALLSIDHGEWPYVTSRNCIAGSLLGDAGLSPKLVDKVIGVARTYPIRVGGPSGPMGSEISGADLAKLAGLPAPVNETATVTGRPRRYALLDLQLLRRAAQLNGVTSLFVSFIDYLDGRLREQTASDLPTLARLFHNYPHAAEKLASMAAATQASLIGVSWGPTQDQGILE